MKSVKEILNQYEEKPSADVWERLDARLDEEMPVMENVPQLHRVKLWKWVAVGLSALTVGGVLTLGVVLHHRGNQDVIVENNAKTVENELVDEMDVVVETVEPLEQGNASDLVKPTDVLSPNNNVEDKSMDKPDVKIKEETIAPKANARQIVLPPNSTLAKQLAADPVLKNLSDDSVDWSLPVHLSIPNLFTPNNDGVNDFFVIEGLEQYSSPKLVVRDKNNRIVYQSDAYKNTWGGDNCPEGVYSYEFTFVFNGIENQATGKVRIIKS